MRFLHKHIKLITVGAACAAAGAGASAVAVAGASPTTSQTTTHRRLAPRALIRRTVQGDLVVATRHGFVHVDVARGQVESVSGSRLTLLEGTRKASYRTVQLNLPSHTRVRDDRRKSTLSAVKPGQRAVVIQAPNRALVIARTPSEG